MKTLIATTVLVLTTGIAGAFDFSTINEQEYYGGQPDSRLITNHANNPPELYQDGGFSFINEKPHMENDGVTVNTANDDPSLYEEGNWPV